MDLTEHLILDLLEGQTNFEAGWFRGELVSDTWFFSKRGAYSQRAFQYLQDMQKEEIYQTLLEASQTKNGETTEPGKGETQEAGGGGIPAPDDNPRIPGGGSDPGEGEPLPPQLDPDKNPMIKQPGEPTGGSRGDLPGDMILPENNPRIPKK